MSKISNPEGAVRILKRTLAKVVREAEEHDKAQERRIKRLEVRLRAVEQGRDVAMESAREGHRDAGILAAAVKDAIHALTGTHPPTDDARELGGALLEFVRGAMKTIEQNNVEGAEQRERIRDLEAIESARMLTLEEDNVICGKLGESRLGDLSPIEAVEKALRAESLEPIVVTAPSAFLRGETRLMREYRPS